MSERKLTREDIAKADWLALMDNAAFLRTLYTILETAGMFASDFHSDGRIHAFGAGRRSLGLDILRTAQQSAGPEALTRILSEEQKTLKEAPHDRRSADDYRNDRARELGGPDPDLRDPGTGLTYLKYD